MKKKFTFSIICLFLALASYAQELANFMGNKPIVSPEITASEITFRISAPYADTVKLYGSWMKDMKSAVKLTMDEKGLWSATVPAPKPELYTYSFFCGRIVGN